MTKRGRLPWVCLLLVAACDGPPAPTPAERAVASGAEAASAPLPELSSTAGRAIEPAMRIDGWAENLEVIHWIVVSPDGWLALPQPQSHAVRFFGEDGTPLGSVGREGEGPGEFQALTRAPTLFGERRPAGWVADDYDVPSVVRYDVEGGLGG